MKLKCLIIDDEPLAHQVIVEYAREVPFLEIAGQCYLATEALVLLNKQTIDLIFLDIHMPKIKGLDFLRTLAVRPLVIITSAHQEYALEGFELDVCDYLLKPFRFERFLKAANKALELHSMSEQQPSQTMEPSSQPAQQLFIKADKRLLQIDIADIYHLESYGNYVKVWMGDDYHLTPGTLANFAAQLPESQFFRIHKSHLINRRYIDYIEGNLLVLKNKKTLPIGKNQRKEFRKFLA